MDLLRNVPLGLYLESPRTWLHKLDPRIKLFWLLSLLLSPILANDIWRLGLVSGLLGLTVVSGLPLRVWRRQVPLVLILGILTFTLTALAPDALGVTPMPQRISNLDPDIPAYGLVADVETESNTALEGFDPSQWPQPYRYRVLEIPRILFLGPWQMTRRSMNLGIRVGTLIFLLLYATGLFLLTTAPEEIAEAMERILNPLKQFGIPVAEIILTLTLALRFLPLVLEEVQNLIRAVRTRDIRWQLLSLRGSVQAILTLVERLLENLLLRAEQTAAAMQARGYSGPHASVRWHILTLGVWDWIFILGLPVFWGIRLTYFNQF